MQITVDGLTLTLDLQIPALNGITLQLAEVIRQLIAMNGTLGYLIARQAEELTKLGEIKDMAATSLQPIIDAVTNNSNVVQSAVQTFQMLAQQIAANSSDPAQVQSLAQQINDQSQQLANAIVASTSAQVA